MKPFNIKLSDEHRAKLEAYRSARGLRSEADAVRDLIDRAGDGHAPAAVEPAPAPRPAPASQSFSHGRSKTVVVDKTQRRALIGFEPGTNKPIYR